MKKVNNYIEFIDESVKISKDRLEREELNQFYSEKDNTVDGNKFQDAYSEGGERGYEKAYILSTHVTLVDTQRKLHELDEEGTVRPLAYEEDTTNEIDDLIDGLTNKKGVIVKKVGNKQELLEMFKEIIKDLEGDK